MKWIIASDIHGSELYCRKISEAFSKENADRILLLGDILYHGPRNDLPEGHNPKGVIEILNGLKDVVLCVRGNCDAEVDQMVLKFPVMADYALINHEGLDIYATHGHIYNENNLPPMAKGGVLINGHTHVACFREHGEYTYINPGSCSIPKEGTHRGYIVLEKRSFVWKDFEGNTILELSL